MVGGKKRLKLNNSRVPELSADIKQYLLRCILVYHQTKREQHDAAMKPWTWKIPLLLTYSTTWVLSHRDRNITAAYLCVRPRHRVLYRSLHLHFVAHAKHCHPKSPTNLPPYGSSPQKETAVAWHSHTAPSASVGHAVAKRDGRPPCLTHSIPSTSLHPNPSSVLSGSPPSTPHHHPLCPQKILMIISRNEESLWAWIYELQQSPWQPHATLYLKRGGGGWVGW